MVGFEKLD